VVALLVLTTPFLPAKTSGPTFFAAATVYNPIVQPAASNPETKTLPVRRPSTISEHTQSRTDDRTREQEGEIVSLTSPTACLSSSTLNMIDYRRADDQFGVARLES
jgi:hypothetical protein